LKCLNALEEIAHIVGTAENDSLPTSSFENGRTMTYVVDERCIKCKTTDCVAVCPVKARLKHELYGL